MVTNTIRWDKAHTQVNSIANTLYMTTAAKLANRKPATPSPAYYLNEAMRSYTWVMQSGLINSDNLLNDGLDISSCKNNNGPVFTYNQGVLLSGLVEMTWSTGNALYNDIANVIATSAIHVLTNSRGILQEVCEPDSCDGDEQQFKGVLGRNVQFLYNRGTVVDGNDNVIYKSFLLVNAKAVEGGDDHGAKLGLDWTGQKAGHGTVSLQTQSSGLDVIVGAACVSLP